MVSHRNDGRDFAIPQAKDFSLDRGVANMGANRLDQTTDAGAVDVLRLFDGEPCEIVGIGQQLSVKLLRRRRAINDNESGVDRLAVFRFVRATEICLLDF